ncbi:putative pyruvate dehydrogenase [Annulohypoxylon nitens]|nr:putative pyruvate dehydrogenase [Annulohypoxylon nitens]
MLRSRLSQVGAARAATRPTLQAPAKRLYTANSSSFGTKVKKTTKFALVAGAIGTPIYWWMSPTPDRDSNGVTVPRLDGTPTDELVFGKGLSKEEVTRILTEHAYCFPIKNVASVDSYHGAQLASNIPCEDRYIHGTFPAPWGGRRQWMSWGIFDGHLGYETADLLEKQLLPIVRQNLRKVEAEAKKKDTKEFAVYAAVTEAFRSFDASLMHSIKGICESSEPLQDKLKKMIPAYSGSSALLSLYDPSRRVLHVSYAGDSRAVYAEQQRSGKWLSVDLAIEHTALNPKEVERITEAHPGEENVIQKDGTLMGLEMTRGFGLARWKLPAAVHGDMEQKLLAPVYDEEFDFKTPPYVISPPDSVSVKIHAKKPAFMIMASSGLWQLLTSQQAIDLVIKWMESQEAKDKCTHEPTYKPFLYDQLNKGEVSWTYTDERRTVQDDNVAVHLVRNALGGNHHELVVGRLAHMSMVHQDLRDDITVQVVFFNSHEQQKLEDPVPKGLMRLLLTIPRVW